VLAAGDGGVGADQLGGTVRVHREAWEGLTAAGRQAVLTHELVHVATAPVTTAQTPGWLAEGLAEEIALEGSGIPDRVAARELSGRQVVSLPTDDELAGADPVAYQEAWLAVDLLRQHVGLPAVLRLYAESGRGSWEAALVEVTGRPVEAFVRDWRAEVARRLG
jgi:hypothetical protein